jgi:hypothetical protein
MYHQQLLAVWHTRELWSPSLVDVILDCRCMYSIAIARICPYSEKNPREKRIYEQIHEYIIDQYLLETELTDILIINIFSSIDK